MLSDKQKKELLDLARNSIAGHLDSREYRIPQDDFYKKSYGIFVTLHKNGDLRGCIGYIKAYKNITDSIIEMAKAAAFRDPRFRPLSRGELDEISIEISLLSPMEELDDIEEIMVGRDGLYLEHPFSSGLLLPQVAVEWGWERDEFLSHLCMKANLPDGAWQDAGAKLYRFSAEIFREGFF